MSGTFRLLLIILIFFAIHFPSKNGILAIGMRDPYFDWPQQNEITINRCRTPNGIEGVCKDIKYCPSVQRDYYLLRQKSNEEYFQYMRQSSIACSHKLRPIICCPIRKNTPMNGLFENNSFENSLTRGRTQKTFGARNQVNQKIRGRLLSPEEGCGLGKPLRRLKSIYPGFKTKPGVYPWIALTGYANSTTLSTQCVGSLISTRHVLISAHCANSTLSFVRLGVYDIRAETDDFIQNVAVIRFEHHPNYSAVDQKNDIAILHLKRDVDITDRIRPICLPLKEPIRSQSFVGYTPFVAAWLGNSVATRAVDQSENIMRDWQVKVLEDADCNKPFGHFRNDVMCAKVIDGGELICHSESGLMQPIFNAQTRTFLHYQTGILSSGSGCQTSNSSAVYTRIQNVINWIQNAVR